MKRWGTKFDAPFGDDRRQVEIYTLGWNSFEIMVNGWNEGGIGWMRHGWRFHAHKNTSLTTADFIVLSELLEEIYPVKFEIEWLQTPTSHGRWPIPPRMQPHLAVLMYPKLPKVRNW